MKLDRDGILGAIFGAMRAVMLVVSDAAQAELVFPFDATPGKLPKRRSFRSTNSIELRPDVERPRASQPRSDRPRQFHEFHGVEEKPPAVFFRFLVGR